MTASPKCEADLPIVPARLADAEAVRELTRRAYARWRDMFGREPKPMRADHVAAIRDDVVQVIWQDGTLVGTAWMMPREHDLLIESIAVAPELHGLGLGGRLLARAEAEASARGLTTVRLYTNALFEANLRFYERRGYTEENRQPFSGGMLVNMMRDLSRSGMQGR